MAKSITSRCLLSFLIILSTCYVQLAKAEISFTEIPGLWGSINTHTISGNGKKIVFTSPGNPAGNNADGNYEVFLYDIATSAITQVTNTVSSSNFLDNRNVRISHDGTRIAFHSRFDHGGTGNTINGRDIFIADIDYATTPAAIRFRRLTHTDERGAMDLTGDGKVIVFISEHNLAGNNTERHPELFKIHLDPNPSISQVTNTASGLADSFWDVELDAGYLFDNGIVITSDRNYGSAVNADGNFEIFRILTSGSTVSFTQWTDTPGEVRNHSPRIGSNNRIAFISNGDITGNNADGNYEVFLLNYVYDTVQVTDTTGGDDNFGGANSALAINADATALVFVSNRNITPTQGNTDGNREIFLVRLSYPYNTSVDEVIQVTDTLSSSPGSSIDNRFPRVDSTGAYIAFNSDRELVAPTNSLLYLAAGMAPIPGNQPTVSLFRPQSGGPGVPVTLWGNNFTGTTAVKFGVIDAMSFDILSDSLISARVPVGVATAPISVTNANGTGSSVNSFAPASFISFGEEITQGIADYPGVSGKDALLRVFTGVSTPEFTGGWQITDAAMRITTPSGQTYDIGPSMYNDIITTQLRSLSKNANINFYIPGSLLTEAGNYTFDITANTFAQTVYSDTLTRSFVKTKDIVAIFTTMLHAPDDNDIRIILNSFDVLSRAAPVRSGVGDLQGAIGADDFNAGLRIAYLAAPVFEGETGNTIDCTGDCFAGEYMSSALAAVNSGGFEPTEFAIAFAPWNGHISSTGQVADDCEHWEEMDSLPDVDGTYLLRGLSSGESLWISLCASPGGVLTHELGHSMGLVPDGAANSNGATHSSTYPSIPNHAFNLRTRQSIEFPKAVMLFYGPEHEVFYESYDDSGSPLDYPYMVNNRTIDTGGASLPGTRFASLASEAITTYYAQYAQHKTKPLRLRPARPFTIIGQVNHKNKKIKLVHSYHAPSARHMINVNHDGKLRVRYLDKNDSQIHETGIELYTKRKNDMRKKFDIPFYAVLDVPENTHKITVFHASNPGQSQTIILSRHKPEVTRIKSRLSGKGRDQALQLSWKAKDKDGDALSYQVHYSHDRGKTYFPLIPVTKKSKVKFDLAGLPGGNIMFRVSASDGFNTGSRSVGPFSILGHDPVVAITTENNRRYLQHEEVVLTGLAYDIDEGMIAEGNKAKPNYQWYLGGNRRLGIGKTVVLPEGLDAGQHEITLKVTDSDGRQGQHSINITVKRPSKPAIVQQFQTFSRKNRKLGVEIAN